MKKENYGIPSMLLCVGIYVLGLASALGSVWPIIGVTVLVFALPFSSNVKKTAVQSLGLALIVSAIYIIFNIINVFTGMIDTYAALRSDNGFLKFMDTLEDVVKIATYIIYAILIICAAIKNDIFVGKAHLVVDGFVPAKPVAQPMYGNQQYNGNQPMNGNQQYNGSQQVNGPSQMRGVQPMNGNQPQQYNANQMYSGPRMHGTPMNNGGQPQQKQYNAGGQPMNGQGYNPNNIQNNNSNNEQNNGQR